MSSESDPTAEPSTTAIMKRSSRASETIQKNFSILVDGCGNKDCENQYCASSQNFVFSSLSRNDAAKEAVRLFREKVRISDCHQPNLKVLRSNAPEQTPSSTNDHSEPGGRLVEGSSLGASAPAPAQVPKPIPETAIPITVTASESTSQPPVIVGNEEQVETSKAATLDPQSPAEERKQSLPGVVSATTPALTETNLIDLIDGAESTGVWSTLIRVIGQVFSDPLALSKSFVASERSDEEQVLGAGAITVDVDVLERVYRRLFAIEGLPFLSAMQNALSSLSRELEQDFRSLRRLCLDPAYLNLAILILNIPSLDGPEFVDRVFPDFCRAMGHLPEAGQVRLVRYWMARPAAIRPHVQQLQQLITLRLLTEHHDGRHLHDDLGIIGAVKLMKLLFYASGLAGESERLLPPEEPAVAPAGHLAGPLTTSPKRPEPRPVDALATALDVTDIEFRSPLVSPEEFLNETLNELIEMERDFLNQRQRAAGASDKFSFLSYWFVLNTVNKSQALFYDSRYRMIQERRESLLQHVFSGADIMPYLTLQVQRSNLIADALIGLEIVADENPGDLRKQLYVQFEDEQGMDEGGVQKEFFQLLVHQLFNPDIGMFVWDDETRLCWFNPDSFENTAQFKLIGMVLGLAIYNGVILDLHLPSVIYRKLFPGRIGTFQDLADSHPVMYRSFRQLLDFDGSSEEFSEVFCLTFTASRTDVFGGTQTSELKAGGAELLVTLDNRQEFINLYTDYLLNKQIEKQFSSLKRGFLMVTETTPIFTLFRPDELELLICGSKEYDFDALESTTEYDGGFSRDSPTIRYFWEVVHSLTTDQKRQLLQFTTGSDRVPLGGLARVRLVIAKNGPDSDRLATAHTCFNALLLPEYSSAEKLRDRLLKAIVHSHGFGML